jgi:hypothetical protein
MSLLVYSNFRSYIFAYTSLEPTIKRIHISLFGEGAHWLKAFERVLQTLFLYFYFEVISR